MSNQKNFCNGCETQCELNSIGFWHHPQIADEIIADTDRMYTPDDAIAFAKRLCITCEYHGTAGSPGVVKKHFKVAETCRGCDRFCRIIHQEQNGRFYIYVGHNIVSEQKNKYDAIIRGIEYCRTCPNRTR